VATDDSETDWAPDGDSNAVGSCGASPPSDVGSGTNFDGEARGDGLGGRLNPRQEPLWTAVR
jgi:hypothetical protein